MDCPQALDAMRGKLEASFGKAMAMMILASASNSVGVSTVGLGPLDFQRLADAGHTLLVIEHNLDVIACADWVVDLGPGGGERGGRLVAEGTPEAVAASPQSVTGQALRRVLP